MDADRLTTKSQEAVSTAVRRAATEGHPEVAPVHLLLALLEVEDGTGVVHTSTLYLIRQQVELAEKVARLSGIPDARVFFTSSGSASRS